MPEPLSRMEDASLYVLDLLDPEAKRAFEAELETDSDLQRHVDDLRVNLEALALAAPPSLPPARVWNRIADRISHEKPSETTDAAVWWIALRQWLSNGWAVATATAALFIVHLLLEPPVRLAPNDDARNDANTSSTATPARELGNPGQDPRRPNSLGPVERTRSLVHSTTSGAPTRSASRPSDTDTARLQDRVRNLSDQVALLTRVLGQQATLPGGAARLQVFRLVATNGTSEITDALINDQRRLASTRPDPTPPDTSDTTSVAPPTTASTPDVSLTLALAAARQLASYNPAPVTPQNPSFGDSFTESGLIPPPSDPGTSISRAQQDTTTAQIPKGTVPNSPDTTATPDPIQIIDLATAGAANPGSASTPPSNGLVSAADGMAFGAYSPDTGQGAVAFRIPTETGEPGVYQLWMTDTQTGLTQSLGFANSSAQTTSPQVLVLRFALDSQGGAISAPTFLITREPIGGSATPTGPVIAQPPPATGLFPNP